MPVGITAVPVAECVADPVTEPAPERVSEVTGSPAALHPSSSSVLHHDQRRFIIVIIKHVPTSASCAWLLRASEGGPLTFRLQFKQEAVA